MSFRNQKENLSVGPENEIRRKQLGRTGLDVTIVGLGSAFLGCATREQANLLYVQPELVTIDNRLAIHTVHTALEEGCGLIDTAPLYIKGTSEEIIAEALRERPDLAEKCIVTTKVGHYPGEIYDFSYDATVQSVERSLKRLGRNYFEIVYIHDPMGANMEQVLGKQGAFGALNNLKQHGFVRNIGIAANDPIVNARYIETGQFDAAVVPGGLSLLNQLALQSIVPAAKKHNTGLVIATPIERGLLITGYQTNTEYLERNFSKRTIERLQEIQALCAQHGVSLASVALQWCVRHEPVATTIPGAATPDEAAINMRAAKEHVPDTLWEELDALITTDPLDPRRDLGLLYSN